MAKHSIAYPITGGFEGGFALVKHDNGGFTYCGLTEKNNPDFEGWPIIKSHLPLKNGERIHDPILEAMMEKHYKKHYWDTIRGDDIRSQEYANYLYDISVNAGPGEAIREAQRALKITETGRMSNDLISAINNPDNTLLA